MTTSTTSMSHTHRCQEPMSLSRPGEKFLLTAARLKEGTNRDEPGVYFPPSLYVSRAGKIAQECSAWALQRGVRCRRDLPNWCPSWVW